MSVLTMPRLGETVTEGKVIKWLKNQGDPVRRDEMIVEVSTDKVDTEIPSPANGKVQEILVPEGKTCGVGTELAVISNETEERKKSRESMERSGAKSQSPIVKKLSNEHGVDLSLVEGTGRGGRVTKKDIESYIASRSAEAPPEAEVVKIPPAGDREEVVQLSNMRKMISERMLRSHETTARVTAMIEVDMEPVSRLRAAYGQVFKDREGFSLTYMPFLCRAVCDALSRARTMNSTLVGDSMLIKKYINLGIAVSVPGGLVVPVIKEADTLNLIGLARAIRGLAEESRAGILNAGKLDGGTFTITNPGVFGSIMQTPIINPPEAAILSMDAVTKRPMVVGDGIAARHAVYLSLTYDHRINDGEIAARFLSDIKNRLETGDFEEELVG